mmetsp:Transcript_40178/g.59932  ORF Transcript_40178/g.59932 Transcript_40178/m.59932 type:complete len:266 (-) Transcript_40178:109-906(-)
MCRQGLSQCSADWDGTAGYPTRALVPHFLGKMLRQRPSAVVVVGASEDPWRDLAFWTPLIQQSAWTVVLVDANPSACWLLRQKFASQKNVHVVNAVVSASGSDNGTVPFWMFSPRMEKEFPGINVPLLWYHNSLNRSFLEESFLLTFPNRIKHHGKNYTLDEWKSMLAYVESVDVKTVTPAALLEQASVAPSAVDVLMTDVEGADFDVVTAFMAVPSFAPVAIKFEYKLLDVIPASERLIQNLHYQHGYTMLIASEFDMMAIRER